MTKWAQYTSNRYWLVEFNEESLHFQNFKEAKAEVRRLLTLDTVDEVLLVKVKCDGVRFLRGETRALNLFQDDPLL